MRPPKILFLITEDWYFWSHRLSVARTVRDVGCEVIVATAPGNLEQQIKAERFHFYPVRLRRIGLNPVGELLAIVDLIALYRQIRPDIVHHVAVKPILYGSWAAKIVGVPCIVNAVTGLGYVFIPGGWKRTFLRKIIECVYRICLLGDRTKVIFQNPDDQGLFVEKGLVKKSQAVLIFGSGVDTTRFRPTPEHSSVPVILLASRMLWDKGILELVEAGRILKERKIPVKIILSGIPDRSNPASIPETQLLAWRQEKVVDWDGFQGDMPSALEKAHIACLPSYREGLPLALIEAAACARSIVTTDVPGCREIVRDGWNGFLVPVRDPVALADALQKLATNPDLRKEMGHRSRELVLERFSKEIVIKETLSLYKGLLGNLWPS